MIMDKRTLMESVIALVLAAVVAISVLSFTNSYLGTDTPQVAVTTGSMLPVYNGYQDTGNAPVHPFRGDLLIIKGESDYSVGDVIVFDDPRGVTKIPIVHRIIDVKIEAGQVFYRTKGDNNVIADPFWVPKENVHGRVILRIPHVGWLSLLMRTDPYRYFLIVAIGGILLFSAFRSEEEDEERDETEDLSNETTVTTENKDSVASTNPRHPGFLLGVKAFLGDPQSITNSLKALVKNGYFLIIFTILTIFIAGNLATWVLMEDDVTLTTVAGNSNVTLNGQTFNLNEPGLYSWESNESLVMGLYTVVTIKSSGFFNWVQRIDFTTTSDYGLKKTVTWTIVYAWSGEKTIDWLILIAFPNTMNLTSAFDQPVAITLEITVHSAGLLASPPTTKSLTFFLVS